MSYGTTERFASKKALREAVAARGAANVGVFGTSAFGNENATTVEQLINERGAVIVGPDVERDRRWYANVKLVKGNKVVIV